MVHKKKKKILETIGRLDDDDDDGDTVSFDPDARRNDIPNDKLIFFLSEAHTYVHVCMYVGRFMCVLVMVLRKIEIL